jgi:feruloyl esterase
MDAEADAVQQIWRANGGLARVREFERFFMVPGMNHCLGGAGAVNFGQSFVAPVSRDPEHDAVAALERWVEQGGDPNSASSFACVGEHREDDGDHDDD